MPRRQPECQSCVSSNVEILEEVLMGASEVIIEKLGVQTPQPITYPAAHVCRDNNFVGCTLI